VQLAQWIYRATRHVPLDLCSDTLSREHRVTELRRAT
jgi:hypothetical protein